MGCFGGVGWGVPEGGGGLISGARETEARDRGDESDIPGSESEDSGGGREVGGIVGMLSRARGRWVGRWVTDREGLQESDRGGNTEEMAKAEEALAKAETSQREMA